MVAMPFPTRRLVGVFGTELEQVDASSMAGLLGQMEESDLEFKEHMYEPTEGGRAEIAKDVAAFANLQGGLIVVGIAEVDGRATALTPWDVTETDELRIREIITERVVPYLDVSLRRVDSGDGRNSFLFVAVPGSVESPHAVRRQDSMRFPVHDGNRTRYMAEAELASTYRRRFAAVEARERRLEEVQDDGVRFVALDQEPLRPWLTMSLVPLRAAALSLDLGPRRVRREPQGGRRH